MNLDGPQASGGRLAIQRLRPEDPNCPSPILSDYLPRAVLL
jgi:hypothetical protein